MFPLRSTSINMAIIIFFAVVSAFTLLGLFGLLIPGGSGFSNGPLISIITILIIIMPWVGLYISISHRAVLKSVKNDIGITFQ